MDRDPEAAAEQSAWSLPPRSGDGQAGSIGQAVAQIDQEARLFDGDGFLREVRLPSVRLHERRCETKPGQRARVEFAGTPGTRQVVWLFIMVLGYSRYLWGRI